MNNRYCHSGSHDVERAKPVGSPIKHSGEGSSRKDHYKGLTFNGKTYELEDTVFLAPDSQDSQDSQGQMMKPHVAIIKDINATTNGNIMLSAQWFYRPEDMQSKRCKNVGENGARELYYSFHKNEVPAESILHKCSIYLIPEEYPLPPRKSHPGFIVQRVYNPNNKRLYKLKNDDFLPDLKEEIDLLIQKTMRNLGILHDDVMSEEDSSDIMSEDAKSDQED